MSIMSTFAALAGVAGECGTDTKSPTSSETTRTTRRVFFDMGRKVLGRYNGGHLLSSGQRRKFGEKLFQKVKTAVRVATLWRPGVSGPRRYRSRMRPNA
jgi:hypothetical protein